MKGARRTILCVCTGNICRSPMAEGLLRHRLGPHTPWVVKSAGVAAPQGMPASEEAVQALAEWKLDLGGHRSKPLSPRLVDEAALIVVMTATHAQAVVSRFPEARGKVRMLTSFGASRQPEGIPDPIGLSLDVYRHTRDRIDSAVADVVLYLREQEGRRRGPESERQTSMKLAIGADHGGFNLKEQVRKILETRGHTVTDLGSHLGLESVDYPDFAAAVSRQVSDGVVDQGVLICTTGIGMSITANKFPNVRAALVNGVEAAKAARSHNNANILVLGSKFTAEAEVPARAHRLRELHQPAVIEAMGSVLTNKYAEGYPGKRWYGGCEQRGQGRDPRHRARQATLRRRACQRAAALRLAGQHGRLFRRAPAGRHRSSAMNLSHGGHLTHGNKANFSGRSTSSCPTASARTPASSTTTSWSRLAQRRTSPR
jgi:RpiB/LacA/LacB family sugar-phosphate isomerase